MREIHRAGGNIAKQLFLSKKRRRLTRDRTGRDA